MDAFNFAFSLFAIILGLSLAKVLEGFARALKRRRVVHLGWLTPLLAIFIFFDITSLWIYAWGIREKIAVNWATMFGALVVALVYYLAAGLVFPREIKEWPNLNEHYRRNKCFIAGGILLANVLITTVTTLIHPPVLDFSFWFGVLTYWPMLAILPFSKSDKLDVALLAIMIAGYLANVVLPTSWILR